MVPYYSKSPTIKKKIKSTKIMMLIINPAIPNPLPLIEFNDNEPNTIPIIGKINNNRNIKAAASSEN
ncbi:hypothetical protein D3C81_2110390 [compost metagenome]